MNPAELKAVVEYMESERGVEREVIIRAIELALESASEKTGVNESDLRIAIDNNSKCILKVAKELKTMNALYAKKR